MGLQYSTSTADKTVKKMQYLAEHEKEMNPFPVTVIVKKEDDFLSEASRVGADLVWYSDEPKDRGGQGKGPSPLSYLLSSMGLCQFVHYAEHCIVDKIRLDSLEMKIDGTFSVQRPRRLLDATYKVEIKSVVDDDKIRRLARSSADDCYVTGTMKQACKLTGVILHNGREIDRHV